MKKRVNPHIVLRRKLFALRRSISLFSIVVILLGLCIHSSYASSGTEAASFLDIPVGAGPAALAGAYTALASNVYAPTWNPGGLGFAEATEISGQHISYLDTLHYEYASFDYPIAPGHAVGSSIQYLGSGDVASTDNLGNPAGTFSSHYAAYNVAYGQALNQKLAVGVAGKLINAEIDNVSANAYAVDFGSMYKVDPRLTLATTLTNIGTKLTFLNQGDSLPLALHLAAAWMPVRQGLIAVEGVYERQGMASFHVGGEWRPTQLIALRAGYRTDTIKDLSPLAGFTTGVGVTVWGQELAYAFVPLGDLGNTHYFSLRVKFGEVERAKRNLIQYSGLRPHGAGGRVGDRDDAPEYQQLMQLLNDTDEHMAQLNSGLVDAVPETGRE
jgi:hypothetical protein